MHKEYVAIGTATSAWQVNMTCLKLPAHFLLLNTHADLEYAISLQVTKHNSHLWPEPHWSSMTRCETGPLTGVGWWWRWGQSASPSSSVTKDHGDNGRLGDSPGPFTINKTCSIPSVITGSSMSSSLSACKPVFTPHKVEALLPQLLSYIKGRIKLHSRFMLQGFYLMNKKWGQCHSVYL